MSERRAAISLRDVDIGYGGPPVVCGVSLTVDEGEVHVLLGESGSGKTTILRALAGFESISQGQISLFGTPVDQAGEAAKSAGKRVYLPPEKRRVGVVFQDYALFPHLDVAGNVAFGMNRRDRQRIAELLALVGLDNLGKRHVSELSGGQQQRVALARALAQEPRIMLLDEPFSNLNRGLRDELRESTAEVLRSQGMTSIFVTHDRHEAFALADRISVIGEGHISQTGTCQEIYETPVSESVARSVGEVNILSGHTDVQGVIASCALGDIRLHTAADADTSGRVAVRPNQLQLKAADSADGVRATAARVVYFGINDEVRLRLDSGEQVIAHVPPGTVLQGETVHVEVRGTAVWVL